MKHKHAETLKAWADGIKCQYWCPHYKEWSNIHKLSIFDDYDTVRVKPEPKPDVIGYAKVCGSNHRVTYVSLSSHQLDNDNNLKLIFDGETGKLKDAEVIK